MTCANPQPQFISGLDMSLLFYKDIIEPAIRKEFPALKYAAALIGPGSEVLGFDTDVSTDHDWRPRVFVFVPNNNFESLNDRLSKIIAEAIPDSYRGYISKIPQNDDLRSRVVYSVDGFYQNYLGFSSKQTPSAQDWLMFPQHRLLGLTSGTVYLDEVGELTEARKKFSYYPEDVRLYMIAAEWAHIAQEESFLGRAGDCGDEIGSRIIAARLISHIMRLCFLLEQKYCPYIKWIGSAFAKLSCAPKFLPLMNEVLDQQNWRDRESKMSDLYYAVVDVFEVHKIIDARFETTISNFHDRPYQVLNADRFSAAVREKIQSEEVRRLIPNIGSVDQFVDSHEILYLPEMCQKLEGVYV
jgi:hypothetical protein